MEKNHLHGNLNNKREKWRKKSPFQLNLKSKLKSECYIFFLGILKTEFLVCLFDGV
jgi:hypothetical protein